MLRFFNHDFTYYILTLIFNGLVEQLIFSEKYRPIAYIVRGFGMGIVCAKQEYSIVIIRKQLGNEYPLKSWY